MIPISKKELIGLLKIVFIMHRGGKSCQKNDGCAQVAQKDNCNKITSMNLPPTTVLVILSISQPVIKLRYDKLQYLKKRDSSNTKLTHPKTLSLMPIETKVCTIKRLGTKEIMSINRAHTRN